MLIHKEVKDRELYVYMNGKLIYKRWLDTGASKVFDVMAYDKYTLASIREIKQEEHQLISVKALIKLKATKDGGRRTGILSGYRPNHVFEYDKDGNRFETYIGDIRWDDGFTIEPGEEKAVTVRFFLGWKIERYLNIGRKWWIHEGPRCVGEAELIEFM
ncbi:hypothetical protein DIU31_004375 [Mucilaginibacter rubeus]|uniref:Uncharacterized protein n=1 Tax=Mucilaginibacter rubeus TaxID=2027860 RepID=A0AAE6JC50_9SPHI|nr:MULTISPECIES: hypothetical protein [Mucilaginibacter]QEM02786.1 hypothetical protein DIU31_004375 [Mucilaginibacter rubeus]QEM15404.1 hypothetical protein DIU38_004420 [Mucilaginibacter gossypii]QTE41867.1 hypothetical protein J3L19_23370 [Mucilaginibacter rubeus]QTE48470.1 hypothetical protein J3L21_23355 [Mucilaginibacter rubeus]QTE59856.1 hypothetical protein J3L23_14990 [Mucilaginibacter rubeus]